MVSEHRVARQGTGRTMRTAVVATLAGGAPILGSGSAASAAPVPINIKIPNTVVVEETTANFNLAVPLKVTCDPSFGTISFNVLVNQGSVGGFRLRLVGDLHGQDRERGGTPESNFGSFFTTGRARVTVNEFARGHVFQEYVTIK